MARKGEKQHLLKVAGEGFDFLEDRFPSRYPAPSQFPPPPPPPHVYSWPKEAVIDNHEAAKKYGGIVFVDPRERNPVKRPGKGYRYYDVDWQASSQSSLSIFPMQL